MCADYMKYSYRAEMCSGMDMTRAFFISLPKNAGVAGVFLLSLGGGWFIEQI